MRGSQVIDVAIVGGGPAGSTVGSLLKTYAPDLEVQIFEREKFPRDHVGESLLPIVSVYLDELGVWDEVEAANFPVKIGATYRWGSTPDLWNFEFIPNGAFQEEPRPAKYEGQRVKTAFQVDRAIYDQILLQRSHALGCHVHEQTRVVDLEREGDTVTSLRVEDTSGAQREVRARWYVDCSAASGILRRKMQVAVDSPTSLRNVAVWDYWRNAEWAVHIGVGGTRIQVLSLDYGWIWFIPLGPDRTSVGLVVPAEHIKASGKKLSQLYAEALAEEPRVAELLRNANSEDRLQSTSDWSFIAERLCGNNWFLAGDSCGFADPILSAGLTLSHASAREVAYSILAIDGKMHDPSWVKSSYEQVHRQRLKQHIRFADYWYRANGQFQDLVDYCSEIARDAGLDLNPSEAFQWLGTGGFANDDLGQASVGGYTLGAVKQITQMFAGKEDEWQINRCNELRLNLAGVKVEERPTYSEGKIEKVKALVRGVDVLPLIGPFRVVYSVLQTRSDLREVVRGLETALPRRSKEYGLMLAACLEAMEAMIAQGWVKTKTVKGRPVGTALQNLVQSSTIYYAK